MPAILASAYPSFVGSSGPLEQLILRDRLPGVTGVDAARSEVEKLLHADAVGGVDDRGVDHQIVVEELGRIRVVGMDAADLSGRQDDLLGPVVGHPLLDLALVAKVDLVTGCGQNVVETTLVQTAKERRPHQSTVPSDEDLGIRCQSHEKNRSRARP